MRLGAWWRSVGSTRWRVLLLFALVAGGALRVAWVAHAGAPPPFATDPEAYLLQGETIARGHGYTNPLVDIENAARAREHLGPLPRQPASFYPPGYPAFVAAVLWVVWHTPIPDGDPVRAVGYVQALLGVLTILGVYALARRAFDPRVGVVAATIVAFYPNLVTTTATLQLETVFAFLTVATALALLAVTTAETPSAKMLVGAGALVGGVALVRPTVGLLLVAFGVTRGLMRRPWKETVRAFVIAVVAMCAVVAPWTIRNELRLHAFVPLSTGIGPTICMARNPAATGGLNTDIMARECSPHPRRGSLAQQDVAMNRYATHLAIRWVEQHPLSELHMWWVKTKLSFRRDTSGLQEFAPHMALGSLRLANDFSNGVADVVLALAAIGAVLVARRKEAGGAFILAAAIAMCAVPILLFGDPRYRVPAEPFLAILCSVALVYGWSWRAARSASRSPRVIASSSARMRVRSSSLESS